MASILYWGMSVWLISFREYSIYNSALLCCYHYEKKQGNESKTRYAWAVANPAGAVKVKVHGAFSANLDSPARVRFVVIKAGKHPWCLPASFDFGCRGRGCSRQESTETHLISMYVSTRGTRDGGLYTCRRSPETDWLFVRSRSQEPRPFSCRCKRGAKATHPASPVSRASRYNTLHLACKVVFQRGRAAPFGNPFSRPTGREKGLPSTSIHQSIYHIIHYMD